MFTFGLGNGDLGDVVAPLAGAAWVVVPVLGILWLLLKDFEQEKTKRHAREMLHRERMAAFEKGMTEALERSIASDMTTEVKRENPYGLLVAGIITIGAGLALTSFFAIALVDQEERSQGMAVGIIPAVIGLALILAWGITRRRKNGNGAPPVPPRP